MKFSASLLLSILLWSAGAFGQAESTVSRTAADSFQARYNAGDYAGVFALFGPAMQQALPLDKTTAFFSGLKEDAGAISSRRFARYEHGAAVYKTQFERALLGLHITVDDAGRIVGMYVRPFTETVLPTMVRNTTRLKLPFRDEWTVIWGGDTKELNYHVESAAQKNAFDMVITDSEGKSYRGDGKRNEDYYAFGKELLAPCDGEVVLVVDGVKDNTPGTSNPVYVPGNTVIIKTAGKEYLFFAHFKQHSIRVKQGQKVKSGDLLGLCGNTGNSSEPHLHFHIMNTEDMNVATGVKCYFDRILVNGKEQRDYSPVQKDKIQTP